MAAEMSRYTKMLDKEIAPGREAECSFLHQE